MEQHCCQCAAKHTQRSEEQKKALIHRLNRIEGQIRGIRKMIEEDAYCNDVLIQSAAATSALRSFSKQLLSAHVHTCVARDIREGKDEVIDELIDTMGRLMK